MKIVFIGFNSGPTKNFTNGPGISLHSLLSTIGEEYTISVFTVLPVELGISGVKFFKLNDLVMLKKEISEADIVHHWSGIDNRFIDAIKLANLFNVKVISGPNVLDTVQKDKELIYITKVRIDKFLTVNDRIKYLLAKEHSIYSEDIYTFIVGPNLKLWKPQKNKENFILWKGNCKHIVKDVKFGLRLMNNLPQYKFIFLGYPDQYDYMGHISAAKSARLYINTSLSETKSQALLESWTSGVPSITHPKIYMHGINYKTGIITNKNIDDYSAAIIEVMENETLYKDLSAGAATYVEDNFSNIKIKKQYEKIIS